MPSPTPPSAPVPDFAHELNAQQLDAVTTQQRFSLVIAGAGSGKTRTLTYRVAWLLAHGVPGQRILLLTFTDKASREMLERVRALIGPQADGIWGGTFHSVANRILRRHAALLSYRPGFSILDSDDQKTLMRRLVREHAGRQPKSNPFPKPEVLLNMHSLAVNTCRPWEDVLSSAYPSLTPHKETIDRIFTAYRDSKLAAHAMDFDDLLLNLLRLMDEHPAVSKVLQEHFAHVLVDEYQDTNPLQDSIICRLCGGPHTGLMAVGDDAQSIYSWRGARVEHILEFSDRFPGAVVFKIETNYRSVAPILALSDAAIAANKHRFRKNLIAARGESASLPVIVPAPDSRTEALYVADNINRFIDAGIPPHEIAVLYRAHFHSLDVQMELSRLQIPYRITGGLRFFEQAHVKDAIAYLRLLANPSDAVAFRRIVQTFPHVGEASAEKLRRAWQTKWNDFSAENPGHFPESFAVLMRSITPSPAASAAWNAFLATLDSLRPDGHLLSPSAMILCVAHKLEPYISATYENFEDRLDDLQQIARSLADVEDLDDFLSRIALLSEVDRDASTRPETPQDCVTLSTIHRAKGLEWKVVFVIFLGDGLFPNHRCLHGTDPAGIEEETRLFYVAVTRARDRLILSYPRYNGRGYDSNYSPPSRFLTSLPENLYTVDTI